MPTQKHLMFMLAGVAIGYFAKASLVGSNPWKWAYVKAVESRA